MAALQFGYLSYLRESDPVDPGVSEYLGAGCQSVFISHEHQAVIVSMGDFGFLCEPIWTNTRSAIVSGSHKQQQQQLKNRTVAT